MRRGRISRERFSSRYSISVRSRSLNTGCLLERLHGLAIRSQGSKVFLGDATGDDRQGSLGEHGVPLLL
jgi:hypothetical protein